LNAGGYAQAAECARQAERDNPGYYRNSWLLAESLFSLGQVKAAAQACRRALDGNPALGGERQRLEKLAREISGRGAETTSP
jgi:tetratricopeptide (TPR) repeat protein